MASTVIELRSIGHAYARNEPLFNSLNWSVQSGEMVALTGPSGRGKSTLLYILGLALRPTTGNLFVDGRCTNKLPDRHLARLRAEKIGFIFQDAALDESRSVLDNVCERAVYRGVPRREVTPEAFHLLDEFGVELRANARPGQVSGGQAQRISLCRALLGGPEVILADEPTGHLDSSASIVVVDALSARARAGATVIIATHDPFVVVRCDREIIL